VIRWRTSEPASSTVLFGPASEVTGGAALGPEPGALTASVHDAALTTEHELTLTGLSPNTRYYYAVGHGSGDGFQPLAGDDAGHFFDTAPTTGQPKPTRIWVLGDSGWGNNVVRDVRDRYYELTADRHTELWLMLGDNAYPSGTDAQHQTGLFDVFGEMLGKSVLWPTIGNHDSFDSNAGTWPYMDIFTLPTAGEAGGEPSSTEEWYSFDYANIHFVSLDSATYPMHDPNFEGMVDWLDVDLGNTTQDWIVVFFHHPPYSKGAHDSDDLSDSNGRLVEMRQQVVPVLEDHGVDLVLTGHSHSYERSALIHGHHGTSDTFNPAVHLVDGGDGDPAGDGAYQAAGVGTVHAVAGHGSILSPGIAEELNGPEGNPSHPVMVSSLYVNGSLILDVDGNRLDARMLDTTGAVLDAFTLIKGQPAEPPVAEFMANPLLSSVPLTVDFTDLSSNEPTLWSWDFEDDGRFDSVELNPSHAYEIPGRYSVRLKVSNPGGTDEELKSDLICVTDGAPDAIEGLRLHDDDQTISWTPNPRATEYDITTGNLTELIANGGDYAALAVCLEQTAEPNTSDGSEPPRGEALFYLVRGLNCEPQTGTYDSGGAGQLAARDLPLQGDGVGCSCPVGDDADGDGFCDAFDNCPALASQNQQDLDQDGAGDVCDPCPNDAMDDQDGDGVCGDVDNCPATENVDQLDTDGDTLGDACDPDDDNDGAMDADDLDPLDPFVCGDVDDDQCDDCVSGSSNPAADGPDTDGDGFCDVGDFCLDMDGDGLGDGTAGNAHCPHPTTDSDDGDPSVCADVDGDGCDDCAVAGWNPANDGPDTDSDGVCDSGDNCPTVHSTSQADADGDGMGNACDPCTDLDGDGAGNPGFPNVCPLDNCPSTPNPEQNDADDDTVGDVCDVCPFDPLNDADFDFVCGDVDNCPNFPNTNQADADGDDVGNSCDDCTDVDDDGFGDPGFPNNSCPADNCPADYNPFQGDPDADGLGNPCDPCPIDPDNDADADGVCANFDNCPTVGNPGQENHDGDADGDACDPDDDNDGAADAVDCQPLAAGVTTLPASIGDSLRLEKDGAVRLRWLRAYQGHTMNVYRLQTLGGDGGASQFDCLLAESPVAEAEEKDPLPPGGLALYLIAPRNGCGEFELPAVDASCESLGLDSEGDGIPDLLDNCALAANPGQSDIDGDFVGDPCDNCLWEFNPDQADADGDGIGDACGAPG
jgi:PKD repeat protein